MNFSFAHTNINVVNLEESLAFYKEALGLTEARRYDAPNGGYTLVYLTDAAGSHQLELTWLAARKEPYDLSDNEIHIAFTVDDIEAAHKKHSEMGVICQDRGEKHYYFIEDPDGYWVEIIPAK